MEQYEITPELVRHIGKLAALDCDAEEEKRFAGELSRVLDYMRQLAGLNTDGLEAAFQTIPISNVMREDAGAPCLSQEEALRNAPDREEGFFKIPPILE